MNLHEQLYKVVLGRNYYCSPMSRQRLHLLYDTPTFETKVFVMYHNVQQIKMPFAVILKPRPCIIIKDPNHAINCLCS